MRSRDLRPLARVIASAAVGLVLAGAVWPNRADASFPGENGRFVFTWGRSEEGLEANLLGAVGNHGRNYRLLVDCDTGYGCDHGSGDWSPSGRRLVYVHGDDERLPRLVTMRADGTDRRRIYRSRGRLLSSPVWSPDGQRIAFVEYRQRRAGELVSDIYVIRRDGTHLRRVTRTRRMSEDDLDWSSRNRLVFRSGRRFWERRHELFTMRPNGEGLRQLTDNDVPDRQPDWAPGGRRLTFVRGAEVWTTTASGENASRIAPGHSPTWAPDRSLIAYVGEGGIRTVRPSGQDDTLIGLPVEGTISQLDWQAR